MALSLLLQILWLLTVRSSSSSAQATKLDCPSHCGNVSVPFPFGIRNPKCFRDDSFAITCNDSYNPPKLFLASATNIEVHEISLEGHLNIIADIVRECQPNSSSRLAASSSSLFSANSSFFMSLGDDSPYTFSDTGNKFIAVGCNIVATTWMVGSRGRERKKFTTHPTCPSVCRRGKRDSEPESSCSGFGCCQAPIPRGLKRYAVKIQIYGNSSEYSSNANASRDRCSAAFLMDQREFAKARSDLSQFFDPRKQVPVVLDWAIGNQTCDQAPGKLECGPNTRCRDSDAGIGYHCVCEPGFDGNPYDLDHGCQDIDECANSSISRPCTHICKNTQGSYCCSCPFGTVGDGRTAGTGCKPALADPDTRSRILRISLGISLGLFLLVGSGASLYWGLRRRKLMKLKEKFFKQNGGVLLKQKTSSHEGCFETTKTFTTEDLVRATNNYDKSRIIGRGGSGTVYKGVLSDQRIVAIKKSRIMDESQIEQFINEVVILSQISHRNVVKLVGCCLETQVPLLVYEFIPNGTLFEHIHKEEEEEGMSPISWENRIRIAAETAGALAYLHSAASMPIIHRDVKSMNILLDCNYTAKVSDFGASRSVPFDQTHVTTLVQGSMGYLDPEYFQTSQLTEKSDVYSFGVVLLELLTGEKPVSFERNEEERNLVTYFLSQSNGNHLFEILDARVVDEGEIEQIQEVVELAKRCLRLKGEERPTMKEVAAELEGLRRFRKHAWLQTSNAETKHLLSGSSECHDEDEAG